MTEPKFGKCPKCKQDTLAFNFDPDGNVSELCLNHECDYSNYDDFAKPRPMDDDDDIPFQKGDQQ